MDEQGAGWKHRPGSTRFETEGCHATSMIQPNNVVVYQFELSLDCCGYMEVMEAQKVLIVEDENIVALDMSQRLRRLGYNVIGTAPSGR